MSREQSPQRLARGFAAGCAAGVIPLPGLPILLSLVFSMAVRGSLIAAFVGQTLLTLSFIPLVRIQLWIGSFIWAPGHPILKSHDADVLQHAIGAWSILAPVQSTQRVFEIAGERQSTLLIPLVLGVAATAGMAAALAYTIGVMLATKYYTWRVRKRTDHGMVIRSPRAHLTLQDCPAEPYSEKAWTLLDRFLDRYAIYPATFGSADSVKLLVDGTQAYPEMLRVIGAARRTVDVETYILRDDHTGKRFAAAWIDAAKRGARVRVLYDGVGGLGLTRDYVDKLLDAGIQVRVFRPLSTLWRRGFGAMNRRDHRKIIIVDDEIAFTGGLNIADDYADKSKGGAGWRDTHLRLDGAFPAEQFHKLFSVTWHKADPFTPAAQRNGSNLPKGPGATPAAPGSPPFEGPEIPVTSSNVAIQVLSNKEFLQRVRIRRAYLRAIANASHYILIENAYFIPDRGIRQALRKAVKRGVTVGIVVAMYSDVELAAMASRALYSEMLDDGIRLFEYPVSMVHSKIAVIDDAWSMVSSYNFDHRSLIHSLEAGALLLDRPFAQTLRRQIVADISKCREITREFHQIRAWEKTLMETLAYQCRYWL